MTMFDLITIGRANMDLFADDVGADFVDVTSFSPQVGGSPTNIAIGGAQLGLKTAVLTAVGHDLVGDFILNYLQKKGVETRLVARKQGLSSLAVIGVQPPDRFPLLFYRENPPDIWLTVADLPDFSQTRAVLLSGTALARGTSAAATVYAAEVARKAGCTIFLDLDLRPDQWQDVMGYGVAMRQLLPLVDVVIGTDSEWWAALNDDATQWQGLGEITPLQEAAVRDFLASGHSHSNQMFLLKLGAEGVTLFRQGEAPMTVPTFPIEVLNTVGAGDAFASGLIYSRLQGKNWAASCRLANACGALVVTRHGCAEAMPTLAEVEAFMQDVSLN